MNKIAHRKLQLLKTVRFPGSVSGSNKSSLVSRVHFEEQIRAEHLLTKRHTLT